MATNSHRFLYFLVNDPTPACCRSWRLHRLHAGGQQRPTRRRTRVNPVLTPTLQPVRVTFWLGPPDTQYTCIRTKDATAAISPLSTEYSNSLLICIEFVLGSTKLGILDRRPVNGYSCFLSVGETTEDHVRIPFQHSERGSSGPRVHLSERGSCAAWSAVWRRRSRGRRRTYVRHSTGGRSSTPRELLYTEPRFTARVAFLSDLGLVP